MTVMPAENCGQGVEGIMSRKGIDFYPKRGVCSITVLPVHCKWPAQSAAGGDTKWQAQSRSQRTINLTMTNTCFQRRLNENRRHEDESRERNVDPCHRRAGFPRLLIAGGGLLGWWRKRKDASAIAAA